MKNAYEVRGDHTAVFVNSPKYGMKEVLISTDKLARVMEFKGSWYINWNEALGSFYCQGNTRGEDGKWTIVKMHRWITDSNKGLVVDHINHDTLNNTNENLRICAFGENLQNRKGAQKNNKSSGIRGVNWTNNKWRAAIKRNGKHIHIGLFDSLEDAENAVKEARVKYMPFSMEA
jgi:hypothetical protein